MTDQDLNYIQTVSNNDCSNQINPIKSKQQPLNVMNELEKLWLDFVKNLQLKGRLVSIELSKIITLFHENKTKGKLSTIYP